MKTATQDLENDHVSIIKLTDIMLAMVEKKSGEVNHFEQVVKLIRSFADGFHHAKEEDLLFPLLAQKGFSPEQGPVAVMLNEHVQGRNYVKGMSAGISQLQNGEFGALNRIYENMYGYASLLQNHIGKENNILFRMADQVLSSEEQNDLLVQFAEIESRLDPSNNSEASIAMINKLASIYL
jgi:hemerythrin-like domain-containing protein